MTVRRAISELEGAGLQGGKLTFVESSFKMLYWKKHTRAGVLHQRQWWKKVRI